MHGLSKFSSRAKDIQVVNGESVDILFIIPIIITIEGHKFEINAMASEIHDNVDLVLGVKNFVELEGEISMRELTFKFLNSVIPIFPVHKEMIKYKERKYVNIEALFCDEVSGLGRIKLVGIDIYDILIMMEKFERNKAFL